MSNKESVPSAKAEPIVLDLSLSFEEAIVDVRSGKKNKHIAKKVGGRRSDNYMTLSALFHGSPEPIDGYRRKPLNDDSRDMENLKSRISDLKNNFNVKIWSKRVVGEKYVEYWIE